MKYLTLSVFGLLGIYLRYYFDITFSLDNKSLPLATFTANTLGCILAGIAMAYILHKEHNEVYILFALGFCGGLTTFSGYCLQFIKLMQNDQIVKAFSFLILSPIIGVLIAYLGYFITKKFFIFSS